MTKFIFVTGGVASLLGKGITAASIATIFESCGLNVTMLKPDPCINVNPGTISPLQHGEVFIAGDGAETGLGLGRYGCFTSATMTRRNSFSARQVYENVIAKERRGDYLGGTVQVIPYTIDEIKCRIHEDATGYDVTIAEIGGTVGGIESLLSLEAIHQIHSRLGHNNTLFAHLNYVSYIAIAGETKTKPTQHTVREMLSVDSRPDILIYRMDRTMPVDEHRRIALFCDVEERAITGSYDVDSICECPEILHDQGIDNIITKQSRPNVQQVDLAAWKETVHAIKNPKHTVRIATVDKYVDLTESYKSLVKALKHADIHTETDTQTTFVDSEGIERNSGGAPMFKDMDAILVPGGFGSRSVEGRIVTVRYTRKNNMSYLDICLGTQIALIKYVRDVADLRGADSTEFDLKCVAPAVALVDEWQAADDGIETRGESTNLGGIMCLGAQGVGLKVGSLAAEIYDGEHIRGRHRHRYEVSNNYIPALGRAGLVTGSVSAGRERLVETIELPNHP